MESCSGEAYGLKFTDKIQNTGVLGFRETTRLTVAKHLGVFFVGKRTHDNPGEFHFLEEGRKPTSSGKGFQGKRRPMRGPIREVAIE